MRRRICLGLAALSAASLVGVGVAPVASGKAGKKHASGKKTAGKLALLKCKKTITAQPAPGSATVEQPPSGGKQYGTVTCRRKGFGAGVEATAFHVASNGDTVGTYVDYFRTGTVKGKFDLAPESQSLSSTTFTNNTYTGTIKITGGTGVYKGIKSKAGTGKIKCTSPDTVHLTCTEHVKVKLPTTVG